MSKSKIANKKTSAARQPALHKANVGSSTGIKLTPSVLSDLGFIGEGKGITGNPLYRLEWAKNHYLFQVELHDYPESNPNSGIVSIYYPELKDQHVHSWDKKETKGKTKRIDYIESEDDEHIYGIKYVTFPSRYFPIAWHVTTVERLNAIYIALTGNEPLKLRER